MSERFFRGQFKRLGLFSRDIVFRAIVLLTLVVAAVGFGWNYTDQKHDNDATKDSQSDREKPDERIANYTFWLMIFTGVLGTVSIVQIYFLNRSDQTARKMADAAIVQAKAAVGVELPSIELAQFKLISVTDLKSIKGTEIGYGFALPAICGLVVNYSNSGRTNAQLIEQCVEWKICNALPPIPDYMHITHFSPGTILKPNSTSGSLIGNNFCLTEEQRRAIYDGKEFLWVYCYLRYQDFLGNFHEKRFCAKWLGFHPHFGTPTGFVFDSATPAEYVKSY